MTTTPPSDVQLRFTALMSRVRAQVVEKAKNETKAKTLKNAITQTRNNLRLRARFLDISERHALLATLHADEDVFARLREETHWVTTETVILGQSQQCACGHTAEATCGIFARQRHNLLPSAWRLKETKTIPDGIPVKREWTSAQLPRCIKCAEEDTIDDLLSRFDNISSRNTNQLSLWS